MSLTLKITFNLQSPIALGWPWISFDGLLCHLEFRRKLADEYRLLPTKSVVHFVPDLPVVKTRGIYHCSVSVFPDQTLTAITTFYKRFPSNLIKGQGMGKIDRSRGFFKEYVLRTPYLATSNIIFYVSLISRENVTWLRELLKGLPGLGREINIGFGRIKNFSIEEQENEDMSFISAEGIAMRPIPIEMLSAYEEVERLAFRPPYWNRADTKVCAVPFSRVKLRKKKNKKT